eukprot:223073-Hanusia_phi.AAC.2
MRPQTVGGGDHPSRLGGVRGSQTPHRHKEGSICTSIMVPGGHHLFPIPAALKADIITASLVSRGVVERRRTGGRETR